MVAKMAKIPEVSNEYRACEDWLKAIRHMAPDWAEKELGDVFKRMRSAASAAGPEKSLEEYGREFEVRADMGFLDPMGRAAGNNPKSKSKGNNQTCPCIGPRSKSRHYWAPEDCAVLEQCLTGKTERKNSRKPDEARVVATLRRFARGEWNDLRARIEEKGWNVAGDV